MKLQSNKKFALNYFSDEMIESTSTLVRTESVKSRQSNNTTTSNDSVSYHTCNSISENLHTLETRDAA